MPPSSAFSPWLLGGCLEQPTPDGRPLPLLSRPACDLGLPGNLCTWVWSSRRQAAVPDPASMSWRCGQKDRRSLLVHTISFHTGGLSWIVVSGERMVVESVQSRPQGRGSSVDFSLGVSFSGFLLLILEGLPDGDNSSNKNNNPEIDG